MAPCLLALAVTATVLMVQPGQLTSAALTSPAEAFWRAVLPGSPIPDAILELLHPENDVPNGVIKANDNDPPPPMNFNYDDYRASPSPDVLSRAGAVRNGATGGNVAASSSSAAAVFFLEDAVRVGGSLPFHSLERADAAAVNGDDEASAGMPLIRLYTVRFVRAVEGSSFVVCRGEDGHGDVYGCRANAGPARAYVVDVAGGERGGGVAMAAAVVCRTDTSRWDPEHAAFRLLGVKPGGAAVCHAVPNALVLSAKNVKG